MVYRLEKTYKVFKTLQVKPISCKTITLTIELRLTVKIFRQAQYDILVYFSDKHIN